VYSLAAAAGFGILAAPQQAAAKIIYTPANVDVIANGGYNLDVNGDGITDFNFFLFSLDHSTILQVGLVVAGHEVRAAYKPSYEAGALPAGAFIGPGEKFLSHTSYGGIIMAVAFVYSVSSFGGPWAGAFNRYLGLKFMIHGEVHYGWAEMSVSNWDHVGGQAHLSGYAYETQANKPIHAGDMGTSSKAEADPAGTPAVQPTLALLARGNDGLAVWRRD
jgi:hypothetical protein